MFNPCKKPLSFAFGIEMNNRHKMTMPERLEKFESIQEGLPMTGPVSLMLVSLRVKSILILFMLVL